MLEIIKQKENNNNNNKEIIDGSMYTIKPIF